MDREADKALFNTGIIPEHVHENEGTTKQKMEDYNDLLICREIQSKRKR